MIAYFSFDELLTALPKKLIFKYFIIKVESIYSTDVKNALQTTFLNNSQFSFL